MWTSRWSSLDEVIRCYRRVARGQVPFFLSVSVSVFFLFWSGLLSRPLSALISLIYPPYCTSSFFVSSALHLGLCPGRLWSLARHSPPGAFFRLRFCPSALSLFCSVCLSAFAGLFCYVQFDDNLHVRARIAVHMWRHAVASRGEAGREPMRKSRTRLRATRPPSHGRGRAQLTQSCPPTPEPCLCW